MQVNGTGRSLRWTAPISSEKIKKAKEEGMSYRKNITAKEILYDSLWLINKLNECLDHILYGDAKEKAVSCILDIVRMQCNFEYNVVYGEEEFIPKQEITSATERYDELKAMLPEALRDKICPPPIRTRQQTDDGTKVTVTLVIQPETQTSENPFRLELAFEYTEEDNHEATDLTTPPARGMSRNITGSLSKFVLVAGPEPLAPPRPDGPSKSEIIASNKSEKSTELDRNTVPIALASNDGDKPSTIEDGGQRTVDLPGQRAGMDAPTREVSTDSDLDKDDEGEEEDYTISSFTEQDSLAKLGEVLQLQETLDMIIGHLRDCEKQSSEAEDVEGQLQYALQAIEHYEGLKALLPKGLRDQICPTTTCFGVSDRNEFELVINDDLNDSLGANVFIFQMIPKQVDDCELDVDVDYDLEYGSKSYDDFLDQDILNTIRRTNQER